MPKLLLTACNAAFVLVSWDLFVRVREVTWAGPGLEQWTGLLAAWLLFGLLLFVPSLAVHFATRKRLSPSVSSAITNAVICAVFIFIASFHSRIDDAPPLPFYAAEAVLVLLALGSIAVFPERCGGAMVALATSALISTAAVLTADRFLFLDPHWASLSSQFGLAVFVGSAIVIAACGLWRGTARQWGLASLGALTAFGMVPLALAILYPFVASRAEQSHARSLVLITTDAMRADVASVYGGPTRTPALESLAADGTVFDWAFSLAPWTIPSMKGMFTSSHVRGLTPNASREQWHEDMFQYWIDRDHRTLAERLSAAGYRTFAFVGQPSMGQPDDIARGFERVISWVHAVPQRSGWLSQSPFWHDVLRAVAPRYATIRAIDSSAVITAFARRTIRMYNDEPLFLWVHLMDPHEPYTPPPAFLDGAPGPSSFYTKLAPWWDGYPFDEREFLQVDEPAKADAYRLYQAEVRYVDDCVGKIRAEIASSGIADRTFICFTADHGESFWEHGRYGHGCTVYNPEIHVPLLVAGPGIVPQRIATPVSLIDVMPTLAALTGTVPNAVWSGSNWTPVLSGNTDAATVSRPVFSGATNARHWPGPLETVVAWPYKLIHRPGDGHVELYRLDEDPGEANDLAPSEPAQCEALLALLAAWQPLRRHPIGTAGESATAPAANPAMEETLEEQIRSLGYIN